MTEGLGNDEFIGTDDDVVFRLAPDCTISDLTEGAYYHAVVDNIVEYGMFVRLADALTGLVHESNYSGQYDTGDELVVELVSIRENGDLGFVPVRGNDFETEILDHEYEVTRIEDLQSSEGETIDLEGEVVQLRQTSGPTLIYVADETGVVPCAAFEGAGIRAYPDIELGDCIHLVGRVDESSHGLQVEVDSLRGLSGSDAEAVRDQRDQALAIRSTPHEIQPLVEWPALSELIPGLEQVAERLRRAVLENRPIIIRHHADTDGICASYPVEVALSQFISETHTDPEASRHLLNRRPSKAPYYELEDVTRDLSHALSGRSRHGQKLPLLLMIDNGSTAEDVPAYKHLETYGIPVIVIDHHHPDEESVAPYIVEHVNPYTHDEDYRVTAGMMCVELARMIDPTITCEISHLPAVAGLADRSTAGAMEDYLALANETGYEKSALTAIGDALDYAAYWLRYNTGRGVIGEILGVTREPGVDAEKDRHQQLVGLFESGAHRDIEEQLDDALAHVTKDELESGVDLFWLDVDQFAHRFTYPAPGTTTGAVHDHMVRETNDPAITVGYGPDFAVLRSNGVRLDIPEMVASLNAELAGAGVSGGGHLVVGSIRFVKGMRDAVLESLVEKMAQAPIDESLTATPPRAYGRRIDS